MAVVRVAKYKPRKTISWFFNNTPYVENGVQKIIGEYVTEKWPDISFTVIEDTENNLIVDATGSRSSLTQWVNEHTQTGTPLNARYQYELNNSIAVTFSGIAGD